MECWMDGSKAWCFVYGCSWVSCGWTKRYGDGEIGVFSKFSKKRASPGLDFEVKTAKSRRLHALFTVQQNNLTLFRSPFLSPALHSKNNARMELKWSSNGSEMKVNWTSNRTPLELK
jgi:hypothetical protein